MVQHKGSLLLFGGGSPFPCREEVEMTFFYVSRSFVRACVCVCVCVFVWVRACGWVCGSLLCIDGGCARVLRMLLCELSSRRCVEVEAARQSALLHQAPSHSLLSVWVHLLLNRTQRFDLDTSVWTQVMLQPDEHCACVCV
jgi:hypothetical protein